MLRLEAAKLVSVEADEYRGVTFRYSPIVEAAA